MPNLFPVFELPAVLAEDTITINPRFPRAPLFDIENGDFFLVGSKQMLYGSGYDSWLLWCTKTIMTQRWAHFAYSGNAGIEAEEAFLEIYRKAVESAFERTITEALLADPMRRTTVARDFIFDWQGGGDSLFITCTVIGADGSQATIHASWRP